MEHATSSSNNVTLFIRHIHIYTQFLMEPNIHLANPLLWVVSNDCLETKTIIYERSETPHWQCHGGNHTHTRHMEEPNIIQR